MTKSFSTPDHATHIETHVCTGRCVSWTAVAMGALVAIAFSFLLNLLCIGIGISAFPSTNEGQLTFAIGGFIGLTICAILAMFPAGYVAGKLGRPFCLKRRTGELHGLAAWTVALIVTILLGASVGKFINQASYVVTRQPVDVRIANLYNNDTYRVERTENATPAKVVIDPDKAADATAMATFATFFIFFIGMLAACFGGRTAMMCARHEMEQGQHCKLCDRA